MSTQPTGTHSNVVKLEAACIAFARRVERRISDEMSVDLISHNERLRAQRLDVWRRARAETDYWEATSNHLIAVMVAQREGMPVALSCSPKVQIEDYNAAYKEHQIARFAQMLTPAPDVASVNWKRRQAFGKRASWPAEQHGPIQAAIIADEAFLKRHPTRHRRSTRT